MRRPPGAPLDGRTPYVRKSQDGHVSVDLRQTITKWAATGEPGSVPAKGILLERYKISGERAFLVLTRVSTRTPTGYSTTSPLNCPPRDRSRQPSAAAPEE